MVQILNVNVSINGPAGSGKTKILKLIEEALFKNCRVVESTTEMQENFQCTSKIFEIVV